MFRAPVAASVRLATELCTIGRVIALERQRDAGLADMVNNLCVVALDTCFEVYLQVRRSQS